MFAFVRRNEGVIIGVASALVIMIVAIVMIAAIFIKPEKVEVIEGASYTYAEFYDLEGNLISGKVNAITRSDFSDSYIITLDNDISYVVPQDQILFSSESFTEETSILNSER
ncbi:MAG: hypothetical protein ILA15_11680 [Clostridiales bacterium]|nr:hypothetical protein [Clostridiales bacterium]